MAGDDPKSSSAPNDDEDPYYDQFSEEDLLNVLSSPTPNLMDLDFIQNPLPPLPPLPINDTRVFQEEPSLSISNFDTINELLELPSVDDLPFPCGLFDIPSGFLNDCINNDNVLGEIANDNGNIVVETGTLEVAPRVFEIGGPSTRPVPAITPTISEGILLCTCCSLLRVLVHTNGPEMMRLDIYGGIGYFCHAILETHLLVGGSIERRHQTYHFTDLNMEDVKRFIEQYCLDREAGGFVVVEDTNSEFYQAMNACSDINQLVTPTLPSRDDIPMSLVMPDAALNVPPVPRYVGLRDDPPVLKERPRRKTPLAAQRERTGKLTLKDIGMYFHLPMDEAARKLSLCPTVVKKICRKGGLCRWPHRKIKSLLKKISSLERVLSTTTNVEVRAHAEAEIERLRKQINEICSESLRFPK